jgi:flagellar basal body-associated protein FliL
MDEQTAKIVIAAGAAVGLVFWFIAVHLYRKMADAPPVEELEVPIRGKSPDEAVKAVVEGAGRLVHQVRLSWLADNVLQISQLGVDTRIHAQRAGGQTVLVAEIDDAKLRRKMLMVLAFMVVLLMPLVIVGVAAALWHFAATSFHEAARWQSIQIMQIMHVLWPPFLVYFLWKKQRALAIDAASNLIVLAEAA